MILESVVSIQLQKSKFISNFAQNRKHTISGTHSAWIGLRISYC